MSSLKIVSTLCLLSLSGCVTTYELSHPKPCSALVPEVLKVPTPGATPPVVDGDESWFGFGDAQTGQLDKANKRYGVSLDIITKCEERDRSIVLTPKGKTIGIVIKKK